MTASPPFKTAHSLATFHHSKIEALCYSSLHRGGTSARRSCSAKKSKSSLIDISMRISAELSGLDRYAEIEPI